jgi:hypothetical protein
MEPVPSAGPLEGAARILGGESRPGMMGEDREQLGWDFEGMGGWSNDISSVQKAYLSGLAA